MKNSNIEWCDHTANFWHGCFKVSPGCANCYALDLSKRFGKESIWGPPQHSPRELKKGIWKELPKWNEQAEKEGIRKRVFVQSMADFFEDHHQLGEWRWDALSLMQDCKYLDFQVLTKRPENVNRMIEESRSHGFSDAAMWFTANPHVWIGTSVENQETADKRIPELLKIQAAVRFLSCEPLLGPIDLTDVAATDDGAIDALSPTTWEAMWEGWRDSSDNWVEEFNEWFHVEDGSEWSGPVHPGIQWVIVGGESGHNARLLNLNWVSNIVDQCKAAGVAVFVKQLGGRPAGLRLKDKKGGDISEWPEDLRIREFPQ